VLLLDTYEVAAPLDDWLRQRFLPALPGDTLVVLGGRNPPSPAWRVDAGWGDLLRVISLRNLRPEDSRAYLYVAGVPEGLHERVLGVTHGHPLALSLVVDVLAQGGTQADFEPGRAPDLVRLLLGRFLEAVPSGRHRRALQVCAHTRLTTEGLLRAALGPGDPDAHELFEWLRNLSFVQHGPFGLFPHELAADAPDADLRWRDREEYVELHQRIRVPILERIRADQYGITYPNLVFLPAEGRLYLFWRGPGFNPMWTYSDDEGGTWGPARTLLNGGFRHYVKYASNGTNTIHLVYNQRHPRTGPTDVFYLRIRGGNYERVGGTAIRPLTAGPVGPAQSQRIYTAALHGGARSWVWDVATTLDGRPIAVYASFPSTTNHHYWFARWTGSRWDSHDIVAAGGTMQNGDAREPNYSGGITLDHEDPATVYLSRVRAGVFHVERWRTSDGGAHFSIARVSTSTAGSYRPISPAASGTGPRRPC
jgi:hypothetical protein